MNTKKSEIEVHDREENSSQKIYYKVFARKDEQMKTGYLRGTKEETVKCVVEGWR